MRSSQSQESQRKSGCWLIEAVAPVRFTYRGESILLEPGQRIQLPDRPAQQLLSRAGDCVHTVEWLTLWRDVAELSAGLETGDPHLAQVMRIIEHLDNFFEQDNLAGFCEGIDELRKAMIILKRDA